MIYVEFLLRSRKTYLFWWTFWSRMFICIGAIAWFIIAVDGRFCEIWCNTSNVTFCILKVINCQYNSVFVPTKDKNKRTDKNLNKFVPSLQYTVIFFFQYCNSQLTRHAICEFYLCVLKFHCHGIDWFYLQKLMHSFFLRPPCIWEMFNCVNGYLLIWIILAVKDDTRLLAYLL